MRPVESQPRNVPGIFARRESNVRIYCRNHPAVFASADGSFMYDNEGRRYIDFFCGASALNYGHNHPALKDALLRYIAENGLAMSLDLHSTAKVAFLEKFEEVILGPRGLDYRVQFVGPTGANAVEAALKIARKRTGRSSVVAFTNAYHGVSLGALGVTASQGNRAVAGVQLDRVLRLPYDGFLGNGQEAELLETMLLAPGAGTDPPAAIILETVQAEGGLNVASRRFVERVASVARRIGALVIVDDIQTGCGRTGPFFGWEAQGIVPDVVCLSKSLSGYGLPMSIVLVRPEHDCWAPGEHNGTFRGNNLAMVTAARALDFWRDEGFLREANERRQTLRAELHLIAADVLGDPEAVRGTGMLMGLALDDGGTARRVSLEAFEHGLLVELCGPLDSVVKLSPALTISETVLMEGLEILREALAATVSSGPVRAVGAL